MKIFISCALFYPSKLGGPANTLYWLAKGLVSAGNEVEVVSTHDHVEDSSIPVDSQVELAGILVTYCSSRLNLIKESFRAIKKCDRVILSSVCYSPELLIALKATLLKKKVIWSPRGELTSSAIGGRKTKLIFFKLIKILVSKHIIFHATSQDEDLCVKKLFGESVQSIIIPNYMEIPEHQQREIGEQPYFLFLGRVAPIKAIDNLIKGLAYSQKFRTSNVVLKIAGGIEEQFKGYHESLLKLISELALENKVQFIGSVSGKLKYQIYTNAEFLFLVSKSENFGNVVIESLSQGTPVVASKGTPWADLPIRNAGFWIDNSPESIADTVDKILELNVNSYQSYRSNALRYADTFNIYTNINNWIEVLE